MGVKLIMVKDQDKVKVKPPSNGKNWDVKISGPPLHPTSEKLFGFRSVPPARHFPKTKRSVQFGKIKKSETPQIGANKFA